MTTPATYFHEDKPPVRPFQFPWLLWWLVLAVNVLAIGVNVAVGSWWLAPFQLSPIGLLLWIYYRFRWSRQQLPPPPRLSDPSGRHGKDNLT